MKFSFIIPTLNEENYLEECLKSMKKQTMNDYEIIIVDSYSKDNTLKIAKKYGAKVFFEKRRGPGVARNTGAKKARGDILIFCDADVRFGKNFLEKMSEKFKKNIGGGICNLVPYDSGRKSIQINYKLANSIARFFISLGIIITAGSCFAYRRNVFKKTGGFNIKFMTNEDHELAKRASKFGRFRFFNEIKIGTSTRRIQKWGLVKSYKIYIKSTLIYWLNHGYIKNYWN